MTLIVTVFLMWSETVSVINLKTLINLVLMNRQLKETERLGTETTTATAWVRHGGTGFTNCMSHPGAI